MRNLAREICIDQLREINLATFVADRYPHHKLSSSSEYLSLVQTVLDRVEHAVHDAFLKDENLQRWYGKEKGRFKEMAGDYTSCFNNLESIQSALARLGYKSPQASSWQNWCTLC